MQDTQLQQQPPEVLLTVKQAAACLGISTAALRNARHTKSIRIPYVQLGGRIRYAPEAIKSYVATHTVEVA